jgi:hypothetical protein
MCLRANCGFVPELSVCPNWLEPIVRGRRPRRVRAGRRWFRVSVSMRRIWRAPFKAAGKISTVSPIAARLSSRARTDRWCPYALGLAAHHVSDSYQGVEAGLRPGVPRRKSAANIGPRIPPECVAETPTDDPI